MRRILARYAVPVALVLVSASSTFAFIATLDQSAVNQQTNRRLERLANGHALEAIARAQEAAGSAAYAQQLATAIGRARAQAIFDGCTAQNARHDATVAELDRILNRARGQVPHNQRRQLAASRQFTVLLIDRLAPTQDCARAVVRATRP